MRLELNLDGILVCLEIKGYKYSEEDPWDCQWCPCDYSFSSGEWLQYHKKNDEVLLSCEVEGLEAVLTRLLNNELDEVTEIGCIEPDFDFKLYPKKDLRLDECYTYVAPGQEIVDISMEWNVHFWNEGLTANYLTVTLGRPEIVKLRDYLSFVISNAV